MKLWNIGKFVSLFLKYLGIIVEFIKFFIFSLKKNFKKKKINSYSFNFNGKKINFFIFIKIDIIFY